MRATSDPLALLDQLDAAALRRRLDQLDRERSALMVLLRAARARERAARPSPPPPEDTPHAD